jgi:hypothetical protein
MDVVDTPHRHPIAEPTGPIDDSQNEEHCAAHPAYRSGAKQDQSCRRTQGQETSARSWGGSLRRHFEPRLPSVASIPIHQHNPLRAIRSLCRRYVKSPSSLSIDFLVERDHDPAKVNAIKWTPLNGS